MIGRIYILFLSVFFIGCNSKEQDNTTYFGGKIINPKSKYLVILDQHRTIDSIKIKSDNTFLSKLQIEKEGLYSFQYGNEFQYIYLEPKDSLLIRLNTWAFDESIVFSGKNANRNNALINAFLENELDTRNYYKYYNLRAKQFNKKIKSLVKHKKQYLDLYKSAHPDESEKFLNILEVATMYPVYKKIEDYSIYKSQNGLSRHLKKYLFRYRDSVQLNQDSLVYYTPYNDLVISTTYNDTYLEGHKKNSEKFNVSLLKNIHKNIKNEQLKNRLLKQVAVERVYKTKQHKNKSKTFETFYSFCTNNAYKNEVKALLNDSEKLKINDSLPSFELSSINGTTLLSDSILKRKSFLYFRNPNHSSKKWVASRFNRLAKNHPDIDFYLITIDKHKKEPIISNIKKENQFFITEKSKAKSFLESNYSRVVLINENKIVQNEFMGLSTENINKIIEKLENQ